MTLLQKIQNITWWTLDIKIKDILTDLFGRIETLEESGGGGEQDLQSVLDNGNTTNIPITVNTVSNTLISYGGEAIIGYNGATDIGVNFINLTNRVTPGTAIYQFNPLKQADVTHTLATLDDLPQVANDFVNDAAAAIGGIAVGNLYHTAGAVKIRLS